MKILNGLLNRSTTAISRPEKSSAEQYIDQIYRQTGQQIKDGLNRPTASTGKSIADLSGAAKMTAQISNIGGGSKATGGGGIEKGLDTVTKHAQARTAKAIIDSTKQKQLGCCAANYLQLLKSDYPQLNKEKSVGLFKI